jgi:CheY-like chemotaxis protein
MESSRPAAFGPETDDPGDRRAHILVIDDDPDTLHLLANQLEDMAFDVTTARSAEAGLRLARKQRPDLITLDLIMPEMTGWEALQEFKNTPDLQDIPVVIVSVVAGEQDRGSMFGSVDLLTKPVDRDELLTVIRRNLRGEARGRRVLVVEDDLSTQELMRTHLEDAGVQVTLAGNGEEAEKALDTFIPDLILLDLVMPVMDGTAFLKRLREDPSREGIPVIVCTGKELGPDEKNRLLSEAAEILEKGESFEKDLLSAVAGFVPVQPVESDPSPGPSPGAERESAEGT